VAYSFGKHVLIPIVKVIFHVLEGGKGKLLLYNNCELSLLSTIPTTTTTTAKKVLELKEVQWQVTARLADTSSLHHSVSFSMTHQRFGFLFLFPSFSSIDIFMG
jgi:hypothetical protein